MARLSRRDTTERTRARLLAAAEKLFAQRGFHATTVEQISEAAGYTRGAFYAHFADKADIFLTIMERGASAAMDAATELMASTPDSQKLAAIAGWFDGHVVGHPFELAWAEFWPRASRDRALRRRLVQRQRATQAAIARLVEAYTDAAGLVLPMPAARFAAMTQALADGVAAQAHVDPEAPTADIFVAALALLWNGMLADGPVVLATPVAPARRSTPGRGARASSTRRP